MVSKLTRTNFAELLTPVHRKVFFDTYNKKDKQYTSIFKVDDMHAKQETFPHLGAFGKWEENTEGSDFRQADITMGDIATFTAKRYDKAYEVTWELVQDDLYNTLKGNGRGGSASKLGSGLQATEESQAAGVINGGFTTNGYDGVPLFSDSHPLASSSNTVSNLIVGGLTDETLKAALTKMRLQTDEAGVLVAAHADRLVVHPDWEFTARALIDSTLRAGTNNNDKNTLPGLDVIVWDYLYDAAGNIKPWFVQDSSMDNLMFLWREKPIFDSEKIENKMDYRFYGYCRFDTGYVDWRGLCGSNGVTTAGTTESSAA
ncbi:MAG: Mu-like prophage major head subunit gpT family protein [Clostridia bacterium]|nr:Mu-like prophage major head subunit gpT family protein [Clostridia bacterium]